MRQRWTALMAATLGILAAAGLHAQVPIQKALIDDQVAPNWIYDDFSKAVEQSRATKKPILALMRCVP